MSRLRGDVLGEELDRIGTQQERSSVTGVGVEALRAQRERQRQEQQAWGPAWAATGLVFTREDGTAYHPEYLAFAVQSAAKKAGLPSIAFHALRHGHAGEGLRAGVDLVTMSRRLGTAPSRSPATSTPTSSMSWTARRPS